MERFANNIVAKMKTADLISEDEIEIYRYGVLVVLERSMSYALIFVLALILHCVLEIALFLSSFSILRKFSGGIHCDRFESCLVASLLVSFSSIGVWQVFKNKILLYHGGGVDVNNNCDYNWRNQQPQHRLERLRV